MIKHMKTKEDEIVKVLENGYMVTITPHGVVPILMHEKDDEIHEEILDDVYSFEEVKRICVTTMEKFLEDLKKLDESTFIHRYTSKEDTFEDTVIATSKAAIEAQHGGQKN